MALPLPNLDTRRWADLVEEGRALIPRYAPGWTDHNAHDPGITLMELFAWLVEQDIYRVNRIPDSHRRKFLELTGFKQRPPDPAAGVVAFTAAPGTPVALPAGFTLANGHSEEALPFRLRHPLTVTAAEIASVQSFDGARFVDLTRAWQEGETFAAWGDDPRMEGAPALYVGLTEAPEPGTAVNIWLGFDGVRSGSEERERIEAEALDAREACRPIGPETPFECDGTEEADPAGASGSEEHHSLSTAVELFDGTDWQPLDATDATRALSLDGAVVFEAPAAWPKAERGVVKTELHYMRIRAVSGTPDSAPVVAQLAVNGAEVEQSAVARMAFVVREGVTPPAGSEPVPGATQRLELAFDTEGAVTALAVTEEEGWPEALVIEHTTPLDGEGRLVLGLVLAGRATGLPEQPFTLPGAPISRGHVSLWTLEPGGPRSWRAVDDLFAAAPDDSVFAVDAVQGQLRFGDVLRGRVPAVGAWVLCIYAMTAAESGYHSSRGAWRLAGADDDLNEALTGTSSEDLEARIATIASVVGPSRGRVESIAGAAGRAAEALWAHERLAELTATSPGTLDQLPVAEVLSRASPQRAVTLADYERLALEVPGTAIARARAWAGFDPTYPCLRAPGTVTVMVVPRHPRARPTPSEGLLRSVRGYLERRRTIGTRLVVAGPVYVEVRVRVGVRAGRRANPVRVRAGVEQAIRSFLDPISGGPQGRGWPFGRDVFRTEVLQVIDGVRDVDHVLELELFARDDEGACGNVCIGPAELVASGSHEVTVA